MRKVLLVVGLVGASFAGGAAVNGPGQEWIRDYLRRDASDADALAATLPMAGAGAAAEEIEAAAEARADAESAARNAARSGSTDPTPPNDPFPGAPLPLLGGEPDEPAGSPSLEPPRGERDTSEDDGAAPVATASEPGQPSGTTPEPDDAASPSAPLAPAEVPAPMPPADAAVADGGDVPPALDPTPPSDWSGLAGADGANPPPPLTAPAPADTEAEPAPADPSVARAHATAEADDAPATPPAPPSPGDWRARLAGAGVARYWVEGSPTGRVRLRAVIPLAGETAVGQQFEAEADDEAAATELILRRIALWQATFRKDEG